MLQEGGPEKHFIHNHARFTILYHKDVETDLARIVGFEVEPASVKHSWKDWNVNDPKLETCTADKHPMENPSGCAASAAHWSTARGLLLNAVSLAPLASDALGAGRPFCRRC